MDERFVSLAAMLARPDGTTPARVCAAGEPSTPVSAPTCVTRDCGVVAEISGELARLRLAACETFERATLELLQALARDVLMRELRLAPVDLTALVDRVRTVMRECEPLTLVVSPTDRDGAGVTIPVRVDDALEPGDLVVEISDGSLTSRFALRTREAVAATFAGALGAS